MRSVQTDKFSITLGAVSCVYDQEFDLPTPEPVALEPKLWPEVGQTGAVKSKRRAQIGAAWRRQITFELQDRESAFCDA